MKHAAWALIFLGAFGIILGVVLLMQQRHKGLPPEASLPGWNTDMEWQSFATIENLIYTGTAGVILFVAGLYLLRRCDSQKLNLPRT